MNRSDSTWGRVRKYGEWIGTIGTALILGIALILTHIESLKNLPFVKAVAESAPTLILAVLVAYLFLGLSPLLESIQSTVSSLVERKSPKAVTVTIHEDAKATYTHIVEVLKAVEKEKGDKLKQFRHGIFHAEGSEAPTRSKKDEADYFTAFVQKMEEISKSPHWDVRALYNITGSGRWHIVRDERLNIGEEGYRVGAVCIRDFTPVFSPMVIDGEHVFLAVLQRGQNRVDKSIYMHGKAAAEFVTEYFNEFWHDKRVHHLRTDKGRDEAEILEFEAEVAATEAAIRAAAERQASMAANAMKTGSQ